MQTDKRKLSLRMLASPNDVNFGGKVHGGIVMKWIDQAGYACASAWSESYCVTVYVGGIRFIKPVQVGDLVELDARIVYTGNTSMHVLITVRSKDIKQGDYEITTRCTVVFVALDEEGKPRPVDKWVPETAEDKKLENFARKMMEARNRIHEEFKPFEP